MQLHTLNKKTKNSKPKRVGRGGKRGTYSGKGMKGQKARAGRKLRPEIRDIIKKIPKLRGEHGNKNHSIATKPVVVNVGTIEKNKEILVVSPKTLTEHKLIVTHGGRFPLVKILGNGPLTRVLTVENCVVSKSAKEKIEKAGGKIIEKQVQKVKVKK